MRPTSWLQSCDSYSSGRGLGTLSLAPGAIPERLLADTPVFPLKGNSFAPLLCLLPLKIAFLIQAALTRSNQKND